VPVELGDYQKYIEVRDMHNSWFALLIQTGVVGILLFVAFLRALLWPLWKKRTQSEWFLPVVIIFALVTFQSLIFLSQPYLETNLLGIWFWVTLGVARSFYSVDRSNNKITGEDYAHS
jgi:O-antigen ligase